MKRNFLRNGAAPITPEQIKAIKMGQRALGIDDESYRATLWERYRADSCRDLNREQASDLIEDYVRKGFVLIQPEYKVKRQKQQPRLRLAIRKPVHGVNPRRPVSRDHDTVICLSRPEEIDKINAIAALIDWREENGLALFLERRMRIKNGKVRTAKDAYLAIEGLKKMFENGMKKAHGESWWIMQFEDSRVMSYVKEHCPKEWKDD